MNPARAARLHGAVNRDRGELFRLLPMRPASGQQLVPSADPDRAEVEFTGVWAGSSTVSGLAPMRTNAEALGQKPGHQGQTIGVLVEAAALPVRPRPEDRVMRLATGERFAIARLPETGFGRLILVLSR